MRIGVGDDGSARLESGGGRVALQPLEQTPQDSSLDLLQFRLRGANSSQAPVALGDCVAAILRLNGGEGLEIEVEAPGKLLERTARTDTEES